MRKANFLILVIPALVFLAGCGQQSAAPLPTLMSTPAPAELPTQTPLPTLAATPTPFQRPTLPPTWTPSPAAPMETVATEVLPEQVSTANMQVPAEKPTLEVCGSFQSDITRFNPSFRLGSDVVVAWTPVETAVSYRVNLVDDMGDELYAGYTAETTFTFQADLFERGKRYGWNAYPMDALGQQMCFSVGDELFPQ